MNREAAYEALFNQLQLIDGLATCSRILRHWDDVSPNEQPALFLTQDSQQATQDKGMPSRYSLGAKVLIYAHRDTSEVVPSAAINNILDAVDAILAPVPDPTFKQTLGGVVEHCRIQGAIGTDEGWLGNQAVAIVPIVMTVIGN